jgi:hypothetical protein
MNYFLLLLLDKKKRKYLKNQCDLNPKGVCNLLVVFANKSAEITIYFT